MWCDRLSQNLLKFTLGNVTQMALFPHVAPSIFLLIFQLILPAGLSKQANAEATRWEKASER